MTSGTGAGHSKGMLGGLGSWSVPIINLERESGACRVLEGSGCVATGWWSWHTDAQQAQTRQPQAKGRWYQGTSQPGYSQRGAYLEHGKKKRPGRSSFPSSLRWCHVPETKTFECFHLTCEAKDKRNLGLLVSTDIQLKTLFSRATNRPLLIIVLKFPRFVIHSRISHRKCPRCVSNQSTTTP